MNNFKVYANEIEDGLESQIRENNSVSCIAPVSKDHRFKELSPDTKKSMAALIDGAEFDQIDLHPVIAILVSTGWNKNDDVFPPEHVWAAKDTPPLKQFNFMHDEDNIIGVMTGSVAVDREGAAIAVDTDDVPEDFDIAISSVIYKAWGDADRKKWIDGIISEIEKDEWCVSMECLFNDFDYALIDSDGTHKVLARDEDSSWMTKHLRAYGGTGQYEGIKVGRLLKNITFSGVGLVDKPANPRSVILNTNPFKAESKLKAEEFTMPETTQFLEKQVAELQAELAAAKEAADKAQAEAIAAKEAETAQKVEALESDLSEKDSAIAERDSKITTLEESVAELTKERDSLKEQVETAEAEAKTAERKSQLVSAGMSEAAASVELNKWAMVDDDTFESIVKLIKEKAEAEAKASSTDEEVEDETSEASEEEASDDTDEAEANADEESLDDVEESAEASLSDDVEDETDSAAASAVSFFDSALRSTASIKSEE